MPFTRWPVKHTCAHLTLSFLKGCPGQVDVRLLGQVDVTGPAVHVPHTLNAVLLLQVLGILSGNQTGTHYSSLAQAWQYMFLTPPILYCWQNYMVPSQETRWVPLPSLAQHSKFIIHTALPNTTQAAGTQDNFSSINIRMKKNHLSKTKQKWGVLRDLHLQPGTHKTQPIITFIQKSSYRAQAIMQRSKSTTIRSWCPVLISKSMYSRQFFNWARSSGFTWKYGLRICRAKYAYN